MVTVQPIQIVLFDRILRAWDEYKIICFFRSYTVNFDVNSCVYISSKFSYTQKTLLAVSIIEEIGYDIHQKFVCSENMVCAIFLLFLNTNNLKTVFVSAAKTCLNWFCDITTLKWNFQILTKGLDENGTTVTTAYNSFREKELFGRKRSHYDRSLKRVSENEKLYWRCC